MTLPQPPINVRHKATFTDQQGLVRAIHQVEDGGYQAGFTALDGHENNGARHASTRPDFQSDPDTG